MQTVYLRGSNPNKSSKSLDIYERVRGQILRGELAGGAPLDEVAIAQSCGASRTPVREAFQRLAQEGLIELMRNRGAVVKRITLQDVREICHLRVCLEPEAARWAAGTIDPAALDRIEALLRAERLGSDVDTFLTSQHEADCALHALVLGAGQNARLRAIVEQLTALIERLQIALYPRHLDEAMAEHLQIVETLRRQDGEAAAVAMRVHLEATQRALFDLIIKQGDI